MIKILLFLLIASFSVSNGLSQELDYSIKQTTIYPPVDHPGKYDLIYMEEIDRPIPLAPIRKVKAHYKYFYAFPGVVIPSVQSIYFLEHINVNRGETVLDIGTGVGIQAIYAAETASKVVATELYQYAVDNAIFNIKGHNLENIIEARKGDLFGPIKKGETFDVIINNIDYPWNDESVGLWKVHERFFNEVSTYLNPDGRIYYQSGWIYNIPKIYEMVKKNNLQIIKMDMVNIGRHDREPIVYLIMRDLIGEKKRPKQKP